nr:hypothetical protein [Tanacetum cinerariifolium]
MCEFMGKIYEILDHRVIALVIDVEEDIAMLFDDDDFSDDDSRDSRMIRRSGRRHYYWDDWPRVLAVEGQAAVQPRDVQIQQLQTMVSEMSNHESTLIQCILGMDRCLFNLERGSRGL